MFLQEREANESIFLRPVLQLVFGIHYLHVLHSSGERLCKKK
jgi:hypothetical protein